MNEFKNKLNKLTKSAGFDINEKRTVITVGLAIIFFNDIANLQRAIRVLSKEFTVSPVINDLSLAIYNKQ